jgi:hypothetical protein
LYALGADPAQHIFQDGDLGRVRNRRGNVREKGGGWSSFLSGAAGVRSGHARGVTGWALDGVEARAGV